MNIAVIPARGGSKRIPRKNIKPFYGKPMLAYAILAAQESGLFEKIVVSTDDNEIAAVAKAWGAEVPFFRTEELADDFTGTVPVIAHAIESCENLGWISDYVCCIYPSVPFIKTEDLLAAFELLTVGKTNYVYPVTEYAHPIQRGMRMHSKGKMEFLSPENELSRTQDLEQVYHDAGQFYWGTKSAWLAQKKMHTDGVGFRIPNWRVVDIDNADDWKRAEVLYKSFIGS
jgi:pseudaminic acid cytidylyltransferase